MKEIAEFLLDVAKISVCVFAVNRLMFWYYRKKETQYYPEVMDEQMVETKEQANVMSALLHCIYVIYPLSAVCCLAAFYLNFKVMAIVALLFFMFPPVIYCGMFLYFAIKNPSLLMSEKHKERQKC
jgi:Na+/H+ antiporter NhaD/arsenite permease-like protein